MKQKKYKNLLKFYVWSIIDIIISILPLIIIGYKNREKYFTYKNGLSVSIGLILSFIFVTLIINKKAQFLKGCRGFLFAFLIFFFLRNVLNDLVLLTGMATIGMFISEVFTSKIAKRYIRLYDKNETADINKKVNEDLVKSIIEGINGRG